MAEKEADKTKDIEDIPNGVKKKTGKTATYTVKELAAQAKKLFGCAPECVVAAMLDAEKELASVCEAKEIVSRFLGKEIV